MMTNNKSKIYTKKGDKGTTSLLGGTRVPKYHERIEAYGTLDELNSFMGVVRDYASEPALSTELKTIQDDLFTLEALLAAETAQAKSYLPEINETHIIKLEKAIDRMEEDLPKLKHFILPGGHPAVSFSHVARTVCRRAERQVIKLAESFAVEPVIVKYLNRLSDYLFVLGRFFSKTYNTEETVWHTDK